MRGAALRVLAAGSRAGRRRIDRLAARGREVLDPKTVRAAERIVRRVRSGGDRALLDAVRRFDGQAAEAVADLRLGTGAEGRAAAAGELPPGVADALERAIEAVERYHRPQVRPGYRLEEDGAVLEERRSPLGRVGIYVPGGRASYPSTVVMTAVPARLAGVAELVVATPPAAFRASPALRYTLARLGIDEVWGLGGAHAVAALAYGTETIRRVDKIVGPGNAWVTAAKGLVAADVGIDGLAGPSEVVIVADGSADPALLAADLLAQAEHDPRAAAVLVTPDRRLARRVAEEVEAQLPALATAEVAGESLRRFGAALVVGSFAAAGELVARLAPEHLQLVGPEAEALLPAAGRGALAAGAVFLGASTPEVFGDYLAGPSHVLPTCGTARFASALGVEDFVRRSHVIAWGAETARRGAEAAGVLADAEGLPAHAASARRRAAPADAAEEPEARRPAASAGRAPLESVRPEIRALAVYGLEEAEARFKLDQNESPWEPPRRLKERVAAELLARRWARYPETHGDSLRRALARRHGWPAEGVLVGSGSNELLAVALETFAGGAGDGSAGREVLGVQPSFSMYPIHVTRVGGRARFVGPREDLALPMDELAREVERDPRRPLLLCTPNNPTGEAVEPAAVSALAERLEAPLLLDNAYGELCRHDYRPLLDRHPNLVLFRSFSKAWALGGLRVGYLLARPELAAELLKVKLPYNLGHAPLVAAFASLEAEASCERRVRALVARRVRWAELLAEHGLAPLPSEANFLLVRLATAEAARELHRGLAGRGILVRDLGSAPGLAGCLRITVGDGRALRATRAALEDLRPAAGDSRETTP